MSIDTVADIFKKELRKGEMDVNWQSFWGKIKTNWRVSSIVTIVAGLILLFFPAQAMLSVCYIIGAAATAFGIVRMVEYFKRDHTYPYLFQADLIVSLLTLGLGLFAILNARTVMSLIPAIFGVLLIGCGVGNILRAVDAKKAGYAQWGLLLALAILTVALGWVILGNPFATLEIAVSVIGAGLIYEGVTDIIIVKLVGNRIEAWRDARKKAALKDESL